MSIPSGIKFPEGLFFCFKNSTPYYLQLAQLLIKIALSSATSTFGMEVALIFKIDSPF